MVKKFLKVLVGLARPPLLWNVLKPFVEAAPWVAWMILQSLCQMWGTRRPSHKSACKNVPRKNSLVAQLAVCREIEELRSRISISPAKVHGMKIVERLVSTSRPTLEGHEQDHASENSFVECRMCTALMWAPKEHMRRILLSFQKQESRTRFAWQ